MSAAVVLSVFLAQASLSPVSAPDPALVQAQSLLTSGALLAAESEVRAFLNTHKTSADGHYLLAFVLFKEGKPTLSLTEYAEGSRLRAPGALDLQVAGCDRFLLEDYAGADGLLTQAAALNPTDPTTLYFLGRAKYNQRRFAEAAALFSRVPGNAKAQNYLGLSEKELGQSEAAIAAYRAAIELDAGDAAPYLNLGMLLTDNQRAAEALPHLQKAAQLTPGDFQAHRELGKAFLQLRQLDNARAEFEKAVAEAPENAPVRFLLAETYRKLGLASKAAAENAEYAALTKAHSSPDSRLQGARALIEMGKNGDAERAVREYLAVHKTSAEAHFLLGYILFKKEDAKASLAEYTEGAKYATPSAADLQAVAADYVLLKDYPDADKWFSKAVEWNPKDALGWYYLGRTKYNENRFEEAVAAFEQCLKLEPRNAKAEDNRGLALEGLNRTEEAVTAYHNAIAWQAGAAIPDSGPFLDLGALLVETNRADEALGYLAEAARISPDDYRVHRALGKAHARRNELDQARAELERAAGLAPQNAPVHFMLAQVYRKQGLIEKAKMENERYSALTGSKSTPEN